jgi:hypothetical protein
LKIPLQFGIYSFIIETKVGRSGEFPPKVAYLGEKVVKPAFPSTKIKGREKK